MADIPNLADAASPEEAATILRRHAEAFRAAYAELSSAWQDEIAGFVWAQAADHLDDAADALEEEA